LVKKHKERMMKIKLKIECSMEKRRGKFLKFVVKKRERKERRVFEK